MLAYFIATSVSMHYAKLLFKKLKKLKQEEKNAKSQLFTSRGAYVNLRYIAMLYTHSIGNQP